MFTWTSVDSLDSPKNDRALSNRSSQSPIMKAAIFERIKYIHSKQISIEEFISFGFP